MTEHDDVVAAPEVEVTQPELLVDHLHQRADIDALALRNLEIEGATDMQRLHVRQPGEGHFVIGPDAGDEDRDFIFVGAVERPFIERGEPLHDVDRVFGSIAGIGFGEIHA